MLSVVNVKQGLFAQGLKLLPGRTDEKMGVLKICGNNRGFLKN